MAGSWAGAYGAGGASEELHRLLSERMKKRMVDEDERRARADETFRQSESAAAREREARRETIEREDATERKRQFDTSQKQHADDVRERRITHDMDSQKRSMERADDREAGLADREDEQTFRREERESRQKFEERLSRASSGSRADSEPLVSITDPATGQPKLVPRSQAAGQRPASTRDQALTEGQSNAAGFADRMKFNETPIQAFEGQVGRVSQFQSMMPREMQSAELQSYTAAKKNWIASQLRKESGAAISQAEYDEADKQYFPQPGDSPQVVQQKRDLRALAQDSMRRSSGSAGAGDVTGGGAQQPPRLTRKIRNPATGETRMQTSLDGGASWN